jgi:hypothetical protein
MLDMRQFTAEKGRYREKKLSRRANAAHVMGDGAQNLRSGTGQNSAPKTSGAYSLSS